MAKKKQTTTNRVHFLLDDITRDKMIAIQKETGAGTRTDVLRKAINVYHYLAALETPKGSSFFVRDKNGRENKLIIF